MEALGSWGGHGDPNPGLGCGQEGWAVVGNGGPARAPSSLVKGSGVRVGGHT